MSQNIKTFGITFTREDRIGQDRIWSVMIKNLKHLKSLHAINVHSRYPLWLLSFNSSIKQI